MSAHEPRLPSRAEVIAASSRPIPASITTMSLALAVVGALAFIAALFLDADRAWRAFHTNWLYFTTISSAAVMFVAVQRITTARWSRPVIRFLEGYVAFLPAAFVFLLLSVFASGRHLLPWVSGVPPVHEKQVYFSSPFWQLRDLLIFGVLAALQVYYIRTSLRLDVGLVPEWGAGWARGIRESMRRGFGEERREIHSTHSLQGKLAVWMTILFGFGWSILLYDLSMSLDLHFQSTLYGWWGFMTGWLGAIMSFTLLTMWWRRHLNADALITDTHFHDLGKLCFAFTAFWGYLTFSQYLIIWYGNMAEETHFMRLRFIHPWKYFTFSIIMLNFVVPFLGLLSRTAKVYLPTMALFAMCSLIGIWLQRYLEVYPSLYGVTGHLPFGIWEIGITALYLGVFGLCYTSFMNAFPQMRVTLITSPFRDEVQVPCNPVTMEPLPAHE